MPLPRFAPAGLVRRGPGKLAVEAAPLPRRNPALSGARSLPPDVAEHDAIVVGAGPNGLAAAVTLAQAGRDVLVVEAADEPGGGARTAELTLPGFRHDVCSAIHPLGKASPFLSRLGL